MEQTLTNLIAGARGTDKSHSRPLIAGLVTDFFESHGDHLTGDDPAIIGGIGLLGKLPITIIATEKGLSLKERLATHFGAPEPSGYRKALRLMQQAVKFKRPIVTLINTPGAYPGADAEAQGQASAIATNIQQMLMLPVPIITVIFGEGGSGGALALACSDEVWMTTNSMYSVLSPEGFASILWKDSHRSAEAAAVMHLTPTELQQQKVIERILPEPTNADGLAQLRHALQRRLRELQQLDSVSLLQRRRERFAKF